MSICAFRIQTIGDSSFHLLVSLNRQLFVLCAYVWTQQKAIKKVINISCLHHSTPTTTTTATTCYIKYITMEGYTDEAAEFSVEDVEGIVRHAIHNVLQEAQFNTKKVSIYIYIYKCI